MKLDKAITIHTREADDDIYRILTEELPKEQRVHVHCFTDSPEVAGKLLDHFPNLYIGITGVITYSSNLNTSRALASLSSVLAVSADARSTEVVRNLGELASPSDPHALRILLETDAPYMIPSTMGPPSSLGMKSSQKLPFAHSVRAPPSRVLSTLAARDANPVPDLDDAGRTPVDGGVRGQGTEREGGARGPGAVDHRGCLAGGEGECAQGVPHLEV